MTSPAPTEPKLVLRLYVVSGAPSSITARANLVDILADVGAENYALEIVDCIAEPHRALAEGVLVTPTLVETAPEPVQTIVGSLSNRGSVVAALGLDHTGAANEDARR